MKSRFVLTAISTILMPLLAWAQENKKTDDLKPVDPDTGESTVQETTLGLLPNPFQRYGVKFAVTYIGDTIRNMSGGVKRGGVYEDRFNFALDVDLGKLAALNQVALHANVFRTDGSGLTRGNLLNFLGVSGIEALPATRLYEVWIEKKWGEGLALRAGQMAADTEFMTSKYTDVFTNASLGWPAGFSLNMPSGGPSPPIAALGARLRGDLGDHLTLTGGVYDGNAAGPGDNDPQKRNRYGLNFRITDRPLVMGEAQLSWNGRKGDPGLDGKFKVGFWRHFGSFSDQRLDANGVSLANVNSSGRPAFVRGDYGVFGVIEQKLIRLNGDDDRGVGVFARVAYSAPDRNLVDFYADTGIEVIGLSDKRPRDKFGFALAYVHLSPRARALDQDFRTMLVPLWPIRSFEMAWTAVYQFEMRPGWNLQPNVQYIVHPGGGATDPLGPVAGKPLKDAKVVGLRTVVKF